ncbi:MAG TPA: hypothetical protein VGR48_03925, partial [Terriglobales bacterium]|nr:hypothetical protein [Terriglobales bacterium]
LQRTSQALPFIEPRLYQMHSLRGFWLLLLPWRNVAAVLYVLSALVILGLAVLCWRKSDAPALRYASFLIATVLVAPHLMVYDLVILAPAFLLLGNWTLEHGQALAVPALRVFLYICYALPLLEPLAKFSHVQFSVVGLVALQGVIWQAIMEDQSRSWQASMAAT